MRGPRDSRHVSGTRGVQNEQGKQGKRSKLRLLRGWLLPAGTAAVAVLLALQFLVSTGPGDVWADEIEAEPLYVPPPEPEEARPEPPADDLLPKWQDFSDTGRFYFYFQSGHAFLLDDYFTDDLSLDVPGGYNTVLGGGGGYNITDHWGFEFQALGTEPDVRSATRGKVIELSNITMIPMVRFRYPLENGRLVPYLMAGVGYSQSDINDTSDLRIKVHMDEMSVVGSIAAGIEYFASPHVAVGASVQYFNYADADTEYTVTDTATTERGTVSLDSVALLIHLRLFPGETRAQAKAAGGGRQRLLVARRGPFETDDFRFYLYGIGGGQLFIDDQFGLDVKLEPPGGANWLLGGGAGVNVSRHWGFELQLAHTEPNLDGNPAFGSGQEGGKVAEMANLTVLPGVRYRHAFLNGRLVPSIGAYFGVAFNQIGDKRLLGGKVRVEEKSVAGAIAVGAEYFLNSHLSVGISVPYYFYPDWTTYMERRKNSDFGKVVGAEHSTTNLSGPALLFQIKAYLL